MNMTSRSNKQRETALGFVPFFLSTRPCFTTAYFVFGVQDSVLQHILCILSRVQGHVLQQPISYFLFIVQDHVLQPHKIN